jgi:hypothetical protein
VGGIARDTRASAAAHRRFAGRRHYRGLHRARHRAVGTRRAAGTGRPAGARLSQQARPGHGPAAVLAAGLAAFFTLVPAEPSAAVPSHASRAPFAVKTISWAGQRATHGLARRDLPWSTDSVK